MALKKKMYICRCLRDQGVYLEKVFEMSKFRYILMVCMLSFGMFVDAQTNIVYSSTIHTLQTIVNDDWMLLPVMQLDTDDWVTVSFDHFSHEYHRFCCHLEHCNADWTKSDLLEVDYMEGFNDRPIEWYANSLNTTFLYTHYLVEYPNDDIQLKKSGNYRVIIYDEDAELVSDSHQPTFKGYPVVAEACFRVVEPLVQVDAEVSSNTDIDTHDSHQQVSFSLNYNDYSIDHPDDELTVVVTQNNSPYMMVEDIHPTYRNPGKLDYVHNRSLIFPGGNEYRRFEVINMHYGSQNVDKISYFEPYFHAELLSDAQRRAYSFDSDHNGRFFVRYNLAEDNDIEADYLFVHFSLDVPYSADFDYYLVGSFSHNMLSPEYKLSYNAQQAAYECTALLKMGAYDYQYVCVDKEDNCCIPSPADGSFYETENEYTISIYHRAFGERYDRLIAVETVGFKQE